MWRAARGALANHGGLLGEKKDTSYDLVLHRPYLKPRETDGCFIKYKPAFRGGARLGCVRVPLPDVRTRVHNLLMHKNWLHGYLRPFMGRL